MGQSTSRVMANQATKETRVAAEQYGKDLDLALAKETAERQKGGNERSI